VTSIPSSVNHPFDHWNHEIDATLMSIACLGRSGMRQIHGHRLGIGQRAHGFIQRAHGQQHALYVGVLNDRHTALHTLAGIGHRLLVSALRRTQSLQTHLQPRLVHHREHAGEALILLTHQDNQWRRHYRHKP
jgi:hypothetical protein